VLEEELESQLTQIFPFTPFDNGLRYLGFHLKPNYYIFKVWYWLYKNTEGRVTNGSYM